MNFRLVRSIFSVLTMTRLSDGRRNYLSVSGLDVTSMYITHYLLIFAGNADTLKHEPKKNNIDTYTRLRDFWQRHYSAHYMTLVVQSKGNISYSL